LALEFRDEEAAAEDLGVGTVTACRDLPLDPGDPPAIDRDPGA